MRDELDLAMRTDARSWKYVAKVITGIREERAGPEPAKSKPSGINPDFIAEMKRVRDEDAERKRQHGAKNATTST